MRGCYQYTGKLKYLLKKQSTDLEDWNLRAECHIMSISPVRN